MKEELTSPKKYIRAEKTGRAVDDYKVLFVGVAIAIVMLIGQYAYQSLNEQRWFRDATVATPFHSVVVTTQSLNENHHEITVTGWMTKRRCEFRSLTGYVIDIHGIRNRVYVNTTPEDIRLAKQTGVVACKLYPAGATTNSDSGVTDIKNIYPALEAMQQEGIRFLMHGEVTDEDIDIFDREKVFIDRTLKQLREIGVDYVQGFGLQRPEPVYVEEEQALGNPA